MTLLKEKQQGEWGLLLRKTLKATIHEPIPTANLANRENRPEKIPTKGVGLLGAESETEERGKTSMKEEEGKKNPEHQAGGGVR